jgi:hypothetical protein
MKNVWSWALVGIWRVVLRAAWRSIWEMLLGVDRADGTDVGLMARGALVKVHVQHAVAEHGDRIRVRCVGRFGDPLPASISENNRLFCGSNS